MTTNDAHDARMKAIRQTTSSMTAGELSIRIAGLGLDSKRSGGIKGTAKLIGISERSMHHWLGGKDIPEFLKSWLQMYSLLNPEQRETFKEMRT